MTSEQDPCCCGERKEDEDEGEEDDGQEWDGYVDEVRVLGGRDVEDPDACSDVDEHLRDREHEEGGECEACAGSGREDGERERYEDGLDDDECDGEGQDFHTLELDRPDDRGGCLAGNACRGGGEDPEAAVVDAGWLCGSAVAAALWAGGLGGETGERVAAVGAPWAGGSVARHVGIADAAEERRGEWGEEVGEDGEDEEQGRGGGWAGEIRGIRWASSWAWGGQLHAASIPLMSISTAAVIAEGRFGNMPTSR